MEMLEENKSEVELETERIQQENYVNGIREPLLRAGWPWPLIDAVMDSGDYTVGLADGSSVRFMAADSSGDKNQWVLLLGIDDLGT